MIYAEYISCNVGDTFAHKVGNKFFEDGVLFSENALELDDPRMMMYLNMLLSPFAKPENAFKFYHESSCLSLNMIYYIAQEVFKGEKDVKTASHEIARHLYDTSANNIKFRQCDVFVSLLKNVIYEGETMDAITIFKTGRLLPLLRCDYVDSNATVNAIKGFAEFESGCIILGTEPEDGSRVLVFDNSKLKGLWISDFLHVVEHKNDSTHTRDIIDITGRYINSGMQSTFEVTPVEKQIISSKLHAHLEACDTFDTEEFSNAVFGQPEVAEDFQRYKKQYEVERDTAIPDRFTLDATAVKRGCRGLHKKLQLDKNFHIYIHTDDDKLVEQGTDKVSGMEFIKLFYNNKL